MTDEHLQQHAYLLALAREEDSDSNLAPAPGARGGELVLEDMSCGEVEQLAGIDTLIACIAPRAAHGLEAPLNAIGMRPILIGDCLAPRNAVEAVFEGHRLARTM